MKSFLFALALMTTSVFADDALMAKYNLPDFSKNWTVGNKIDNDKGTTIIYVPKGSMRQNAKEFFGLNIIKTASDPRDTSAFKKGLSQMFPKMQIELWTLENTRNGIIYEWMARENGQEKVHGWGRATATNEGNVVLGYLTENISDVQRARSMWLPVLKDARIN